MENIVIKEVITEENVTSNRKKAYKHDQLRSNSLMNHGNMNSHHNYIQHKNECYELISDNERNNEESQQKYEAV